MPRRPRKKELVNIDNYDSDDERKYSREAVPDPTQDDYFLDKVDKSHAEKEKILLEKGLKDDEQYSSDSDEEVLGLGLYDEEEDDLLSDDDIQNYKKQLRKLKLHKIKNERDRDSEGVGKDLPDLKAWGKKRSKYYGADISDDDIDLSGEEEEEGAAVLEEREAMNLQKKMAAELELADFHLGMFEKKKNVTNEDVSTGKISKELSELSAEEKLQLLKKKSPEMLPLIKDFESMIKRAKDEFLPLSKLTEDGKISRNASDYIQCQLQLILNYCTTISFYMMLKAKHLPVQNHPVIKRLVQYQNLMKQMKPADVKLNAEIEEILNKVRNGEEIILENKSQQPSTFIRPRRRSMKTVREKAMERKTSEMVSRSDESEEEEEDVPTKRQKIQNPRYETEDEKAALAHYEMMKMRQNSDSENEEGEVREDDKEGKYEDDEDGGKRAITYQIEKNKGLTPSKKKELKNPRVKHRMKYRKAKIRRRGQVRDVRTESSRYSGEISGIRSGIKRGIKMKV
ncbi:something about silencing protein 10-like [Saccostrea echinata]|uniref:something about silencing protein 10-like n=1 Tax=Saccostrea echinata TaxID=191078 RepID=UPI002A80F759|nr:something about silencing protein 10-like [Saccostrea echinata]